MYKIIYSNKAQKDFKKLRGSSYFKKGLEIVESLKQDPFSSLYMMEPLVGDLEGAFSKRINIQHRIVYRVDENKKIVNIIRAWTHYE